MLFEVGRGGNGEVGSLHVGGAHVAFVDGHVSKLSNTISPEELEALSTRSGGEEVYIDD
jgi:prepilin-type processing-associated H-X9-DG protein